MSNDERPSNDTTKNIMMVMMACNGWDNCYTTSVDHNGTELLRFHNGNPDEEQIPQLDPRDDTDSALKLLGWLLYNQKWVLNNPSGFQWELTDYETQGPRGSMPLVGQSFRYAITNIAIETIGERCACCGETLKPGDHDVYGGPKVHDSCMKRELEN